MARYCFYCNRELKPGERCDCRQAQANRAARESSDSGSSYSAGSDTAAQAAAHASYSQSQTTQDSSDKRARAQEKRKRERAEAKQARQADREKAKEERRAQRAHKRSVDYKKRQKQSRSDSASQDSKTSGREALLALVSFITAPTTAIQTYSTASTRLMIIAFAAESILAGAVTLSIISNSNLGNLLLYRSYGMTGQSTWVSRLWFFVGFILLQILFIGIKAGVQWLITRLLNRQLNLSFISNLRMMVPGSVYFTLFVLVAFFFSIGSGLQSAVLILFGYGIRILVDHQALSMETGQPADKSIQQTLLATLITAIVIGSILNLLIPNISSFSVRPTPATSILPLHTLFS